VGENINANEKIKCKKTKTTADSYYNTTHYFAILFRFQICWLWAYMETHGAH